MEEEKVLKQLEDQMQNLIKQIMDKSNEINNLDISKQRLLAEMLINDYETLEKEYEILFSQYESYWQKIYPCSHIWYIQEILGSVDNALGIRQCLRCKQIKRWHTWSMQTDEEIEEEKMIWVEECYEIIRQECLELESEGYSIEEIKEILFYKHARKNEDLARELKMKYTSKK